VLAHSATATVLDRRHIDYCCEGHRPLAQVIAERGLDRAQLVAELALAMPAPDPEADPRTASTASLISRALARQHRNLRASLALLEHHAFTVVKSTARGSPPSPWPMASASWSATCSRTSTARRTSCSRRS
jgi:regulator of cell morphogenesis and NO signaling